MYKLSASLEGHEQDVKCVISPSDNQIVSVSRDGSVRVWNKVSDVWQAPIVSFQAGGFLNSVAYVSEGYGSDPLIAAGGNESLIYLSSPLLTQQDPEFCLVGHESNVCALDSLGPLVISGSWDSTAKVWHNGEIKYNLVGHENSVWDVKFVNDEEYLTCSADKTVRRWVSGKQVEVYSGHADVVRNLLVLPDGFASCSNDGTIRVCAADGTPNYIMKGHESFIYSLALLPNGDIVSSGEDRTLRVWRGEQCLQTITLPCVSVWTVSTMGNGDIVAGSSDGKVRVFSSDRSRFASPEVLEKFQKDVQGSAISEDSLGSINKEKISGPECLANPGNEGQTKMVKSASGAIEAYQWTSNKWNKVGEVVGSAGSDKKKSFNGKEWDYVFDVDVSDNAPPLKLPYNVSENPYQAAERFLAENELPHSYLDEVTRFILTNAQGVTLGQKEEIPYNPYADTNSILPQQEFLFFSTYNPALMMKGAAKFAKLSESEMKDLEAALVGKNQKKLIEFSSNMILQLEDEGKLVGMDILRSIISELPLPPDNLFELVKVGLAIKSSPNSTMMCLRLLVNMFGNNTWGVPVMRDEDIIGEVFSIDFHPAVKSNKNAAVALSTLILNYAVDAHKAGKNTDWLVKAIEKYWEALCAPDKAESAYRVLVARGTVSRHKPQWLSRVEKVHTEARFQQLYKEFSH